MYRNKFYKHRDPINWDMYKRQRNLVTSIRRTPIRNFFKSRTENNTNSHDFWKVVKPFLTDKSSHSNDDIILREESEILAEPVSVCNTFNNFFTNVADSIGFPDCIPHQMNNDDLFSYIKKIITPTIVSHFWHILCVEIVPRGNILLQ